MRRSRPDEDLSGFYEEIGLELFKYMLRAGFETQVKLAKACELHPSIINRMLKGKYRGLMCRKVLPVIIRRGGFPSWEELDEFLKLVESVISVRQRVKMRTAVYIACDEVNLPDHAPQEQENTSVDALSQVDKIARDATLKQLFVEFEKRLRNGGDILP